MDRSERYRAVRDRSAVVLKKKHIRQFDQEFERASGAGSEMSVLEIGCGTGLFLRYLEHKGYRRTVGVDTDERLEPVLADLKTTQVLFGDVFALAAERFGRERFDRIVLFDVIEHIDADALFGFVARLKNLLEPSGKIVVRAPNLTSPWGVRMFFDTFDHVTPTTPGRMRELAVVGGYEVDGIFEQQPRKALKRWAQRVVHFLLECAIDYHPDIWSANFIAVLSVNRGHPKAQQAPN